MNHDVDTVIRHLLALTGADPRKAKLPVGKRKVRVHTQRIGDVRLITVAPMRGTLPEVDATTLGDVCAATGTVLLRGIVLAPPRTKTLWLALEGAGACRYVASGEVEAPCGPGTAAGHHPGACGAGHCGGHRAAAGGLRNGRGTTIRMPLQRCAHRGGQRRMKRLSRSTTLNTNAARPGADNARTPENVAGDHAETSLDNSRGSLQAIPLDTSLAPALPDYAARIKAWASSRRSQEAGRRTRDLPILYRRWEPNSFLRAAAVGVLRRTDARGSSPTVRHGWHLQVCRRLHGGPTVVRVARVHDDGQPGGIGSLQRHPAQVRHRDRPARPQVVLFCATRSCHRVRRFARDTHSPDVGNPDDRGVFAARA